MNTTIDELETKLKTYSINERYNTLAETRYWCSQYKDLADEAILTLRAQALLSQCDPVAFRYKHKDDLQWQYTNKIEVII